MTLGNYTCGSWPDTCGNTISCGSCQSNQTCSSGKCVSNCTSHISKKCDNGNLYWFNSCNIKEGLAENCGIDNQTTNYRCSGNWTQRETIKRGCQNNSCYNESVWFNDTNCASSGKACINGTCIVICTPKNCTTLGYSCGSWPDTCNNTVNCGTCPSEQICRRGVCTASSGGGGYQPNNNPPKNTTPENNTPENPPHTDEPYCGNGICETGEDCSTCSADCSCQESQTCCSEKCLDNIDCHGGQQVCKEGELTCPQNNGETTNTTTENQTGTNQTSNQPGQILPGITKDTMVWALLFIAVIIVAAFIWRRRRDRTDEIVKEIEKQT
jgi:hypothetical protein